MLFTSGSQKIEIRRAESATMHIFVELITDLIVQVLFEGICVTTGAALFVALKPMKQYENKMNSARSNIMLLTWLIIKIDLFKEELFP